MKFFASTIISNSSKFFNQFLNSLDFVNLTIKLIYLDNSYEALNI
jgi:hypothetical protein